MTRTCKAVLAVICCILPALMATIPVASAAPSDGVESMGVVYDGPVLSVAS